MNFYVTSYASVKPNCGPRSMLSPVRFLTCKAEWRAHEDLCRCCSHCYNRLHPREAWAGYILIFCGEIDSKNPQGPHTPTGIVRTTHGPCTSVLSILYVGHARRVRPVKLCWHMTLQEYKCGRRIWSVHHLPNLSGSERILKWPFSASITYMKARCTHGPRTEQPVRCPDCDVTGVLDITFCDPVQ